MKMKFQFEHGDIMRFQWRKIKKKNTSSSDVHGEPYNFSSCS